MKSMRLVSVPRLVAVAALCSSCSSHSSVSSNGSELGTSISATADAYVDAEQPDRNFASSTELRVDGKPVERTYLRFAVPEVPGDVVKAHVRLYVDKTTSDGPQVYPVESSWDESTVTWNDRPQRVGGSLANVGRVHARRWIEVDVTGAIAGPGTYSFELAEDARNGVVFGSRESSHAPELVITTSSPAGPDAGGGTGPSHPDAGTQPDPGTPDASPPPDSGSTPDAGTPPPSADTAAVEVSLVPQAGVSGTQRINFAVPLPRGLLSDENAVRVLRGSAELPAYRRALARYLDGTIRSVQLQVDVDASATTSLTVRVGENRTTSVLAPVSVSSTLVRADGTRGPRVWTVLPPDWLSASGAFGPLLPASEVPSGSEEAWSRLCDYARYDADAFISLSSDKAVWLYDRPTTLYRGYATQGSFSALQSAYRESAIYRNGITGEGTSTRIGVPNASGDLKYHYTQGMAIHYLLTGDDSYREAAENVALRISGLWSSPGYAGGADFWTERHAGFALLGYTYAMIVSDDRAATFRSLADDAVTAYLQVQATYPTWWTDSQARCFAHTAEAHGESYGTWGCSPWMSAILAEGLDVYARERGGSAGAAASNGLVELGRILARDGRDDSGKPYYWMGVGSEADDVDRYDEHWGEPAYAIAMAWYHSGHTDATLRNAALELIEGLDSRGTAPHMRSFNWQCRGAVATPYYLQP